MHLLIGRRDDDAVPSLVESIVDFTCKVDGSGKAGFGGNNVGQKLFVGPQKLPLVELSRLSKVSLHTIEKRMTACSRGLHRWSIPTTPAWPPQTLDECSKRLVLGPGDLITGAHFGQIGARLCFPDCQLLPVTDRRPRHIQRFADPRKIGPGHAECLGELAGWCGPDVLVKCLPGDFEFFGER